MNSSVRRDHPIGIVTRWVDGTRRYTPRSSSLQLCEPVPSPLVLLDGVAAGRRRAVMTTGL
jgi:hypothetical protein